MQSQKKKAIRECQWSMCNRVVESFFLCCICSQLVNVFIKKNLPKIYKCIRELAKETGDEFEDMKLLIKKKAGLCMKKDIDGEVIMYCKSFGKASKDELCMVIDTIIKIGDLVGMNFR